MMCMQWRVHCCAMQCSANVVTTHWIKNSSGNMMIKFQIYPEDIRMSHVGSQATAAAAFGPMGVVPLFPVYS
jgi:hypothetical protein